MSRTVRKNKHGKEYLEGRDSIENPYICRCSYCSRVVKKEKIEKIANKEMLKQIKEIEV